MQCSACRAVISDGLEVCPRCQTPAAKKSAPVETTPAFIAPEDLHTAINQGEPVEAQPAKTAVKPSTLIEFPGAGRAARPQWRKDLSERVREIQERRAREATHGDHPQARPGVEQPDGETPAPQLGLVPTPDQPQVNPLVVAALKRIERAYQHPVHTRPARGGAAVAVAHVSEEQYQVEQKVELRAAPEPLYDLPAEQPVPDNEPESVLEPVRERALTVVQPLPAEKIETVKAEPAPPQQEIETAALPETVEEEALENDLFEDYYDDHAPVFMRLTASLVDLMVVAFASSPFAAIIELTNGDWADERVLASMGGIFILVMFLYLTTSTALAGRTWGMSLVSLRAVDVDTGLSPTTKQSVTRAIVYILSVATFGLGILYALFDAEGRTAHDHLSGTAVVRE